MTLIKVTTVPYDVFIKQCFQNKFKTHSPMRGKQDAARRRKKKAHTYIERDRYIEREGDRWID